MYINFREGLKSSPNLIPLSEFSDKLIKNPNKDWYKSLFFYNEEHKKILEEKGTLSGIKDPVGNTLYFDFDCGENLDKARQDALTAAVRLVERGLPEDSISTYFTGNKGFSIEVETNQMFTPEQFKSIVFTIAGDLETFDRVVNDPQRIVRIPNTKHQSSGLYKIPLTPDELSTMAISDIKSKATKRRMVVSTPTVANIPEEWLLIKEEKPIEQVSKELSFDISTIDLKNRPKGFDEARWLLSNGFFRHGNRNPAMLCLAATYKNLHFDETMTRHMLDAVAETQASRTGEDRFPDEEIDAIVNQVFGPNWKGGMFTTRDPNNWLAKYAKDIGLKNIDKEEDTGPKTLQSVAPDFVRHVQNIEKNTIKTGIPSLDRAMPITVGSNIGVVAAAGAGKTAFANNVLNYNSKQGICSVYASLDMHRLRQFEKIAYKVTGYSRDELYNRIRAGEYKDIVNRIEAEFGNVWFYDKSSAMVEDIARYVREVEHHTGQKVKMVMIDYFERVNCDVSDDTAASKKVANQIQDMIVDLDIAAITLCQPNKMSLGAGPDTEIVSYTAIKGSSFLYQSFRGIIGISRPFYTPRTKEFDRYMIMNILKNDLGELDRLEFGWTGKTGDIYELEDAGRQELHELMKMKNGDKNGDGGWDE